MTVLSFKKVFPFLHNKDTPAAVILMYHRISNTSVEPNWLAVSPANFSEHMQYLRQAFQPIRLTDLVEGIQNHSLPARSVVITFDDGYTDNLTHAVPILESTNIQATIFVTNSH